MNIDHFFLQDFSDTALDESGNQNTPFRSPPFDKQNAPAILSESDYLRSLREEWSNLPRDPDNRTSSVNGHKKHSRNRYLKKIGGPWAQRFSLTLVSPSVVPNYFPTLRVFEYNVTGARDETKLPWKAIFAHTWKEYARQSFSTQERLGHEKIESASKSPPPGPAYLPQTFSWLGYTQYYANLTDVNRNFNRTDSSIPEANSRKSLHCIHENDGAKDLLEPRRLKYQVEYDTKDESDAFAIRGGLTVRNMLELAARIAKEHDNGDNPHSLDDQAAILPHPITLDLGRESGRGRRSHGENEGKHHNRYWKTFVERAFVGTTEFDEE